ncbi:MAG: UbiA family prenyltransferase [Eubacteriales bacterium]|nr:UbiA family prenyltransferase [Eubacteriales bacterium]
MLSRFFSFVEIRTKLASLVPFLLGLAFAYSRFQAIQWFLTGLFFASMIVFDMATTALNNFIDTQSNGQPLPFPRKTARVILAVLLVLATGLGLVLAFSTDLTILLAGAACFAAGIFYTFGPAPISRMPLGEIFSGLFMGFFIPFLVVQINAPTGSLVFIQLDWQMLTLALRWPELVKLFLVTVTPVATIANIMLANNMCDLEHDRMVSRLTLPHYIGVPAALNVFAGLYYASLLSWVALAALGLVTPWVLAALLVTLPVEKNIRKFRKLQTKKDTFAVSIQNFLLLMLPLVVATALTRI